MTHRWHFFRAGAVDQVSLRDGADLLALKELDQKLWVALAMPTKDVDIDPITLELLDENKDNRIRVQDVLVAVGDLEKLFKNPSDVLRSKDEIKLSALGDAKVVAAAKRMLADLGKKDADSISIEDTIAVTKAFTDTVLNGDGIIIPASADEGPVRLAIEDAIATVGSVTDRSGKPGIDKALADKFFADVDQQVTWLGAVGSAKTIGDATEAAADALRAVKAKINDYFTGCRLLAYNAEVVAPAKPADTEEMMRALPLAKLDPATRLPLRTGVNPAWMAALATFNEKVVLPILGATEALTPTSFQAIIDKLAAFEAWYSSRPDTKLVALTPQRIAELAKPEIRAKVADLIAADNALSAEYAQITDVVKAVRYQRDFGRIVRNFVNFSDFYGARDGVFQAGTLYLDGRALRLCIPVTDAAKHGALAASSAACLIYCDITREGTTKQIAAAITNGDADNVFVGRNGIFYDRHDKDWDATVVKIISNPISVREAFWAPYKKLVKVIEDNVTKRAAAADDAAHAKMTAAGTAIAHADKSAVAKLEPPPPPPAAQKEPPKKIDLGTVAAIGVAIGGIGTLVGALLASMFGLGKWLPLGIIALLLMISGPSMLLAWLKLRRRNLGPILDANGWAINSRARINVSFGAAMTELAEIPKGSKRSLSDPFADKSPPWRLYIFLILVVLLLGTWYVGRLDKYVPESIRSTKVMGKYAPAYKAPAPAAAPAPAPAPAPAATPAPAPAPK